MDFNVSADPPHVVEFRKEVAAWMAEQFAGHEHLRWSASWSTREDQDEYKFRRGLAEKLGAKGWLFPIYPKKYGGADLTIDHQMVLETELFKYGLNLSHVFYTLARIVAPVLIRWGTEEQKSEFLEPITRAQICVWQVLTEPHGGSDIANCQTKAIRDGDDYVVNGQKVMVGHHLPPDYLWTLVCTTPGGKRHENLAWLHIPANLPGITIQHMHMMMGIKNSVFFDNVRVPAKYLIGGENNGWKVASTHMELEHGGDGRIAADPLIERVVEYCRNTHIDGKPIMEDPRVRDLVAEMTIELNTLRRFNQLIYWRRFAKKPLPTAGRNSAITSVCCACVTANACKRSWAQTRWSKIYQLTKSSISNTPCARVRDSCTAAAHWIPTA
jgi:alkylation response protein AidB-like acyl-CoA dehydrogenase